MGTVVIPRYPANFSAWGILTSDYLEDAAVTRVQKFTAESVSSVVATLKELEGRTTEAVTGYGFTPDETERLYRLDVRFEGQEYTISVNIDPDWLSDEEAMLSGARDRFVSAHRQLYGHGDAEVPLEVVAVRCRTVGRVKKPRFDPAEDGKSAKPKSSRPVHFRKVQDFVETQVFDRDDLSPDQEIAGPAIIEEWTTTNVVPPVWTAQLDRIGNLILKTNGKG